MEAGNVLKEFRQAKNNSSGQEVGNIFKGFRQAKEQLSNRKLLILLILNLTSPFKY